MIKKPAIAVIVPTFNRPGLLRNTLNSLALQEFQSCEFLIIDDGSDWETQDVIETYKRRDQRFRVLNKDRNAKRGPQASRNIGLENSMAEFVIFLDSDDLLLSDCLRNRWSAAIAVPGNDIYVFPQGIFAPESDAVKLVNIPSGENELDRFLSFAWPIDLPWLNGAAMIRRDALSAAEVRWRDEYLWDDLVFHFECILAGLKVHWSDRLSPDCIYLVHGQVSHGKLLHTREGIKNIRQMVEWMLGRLLAAGQWSAKRRKAVAINYFHSALLRAIDEGEHRSVDLVRELISTPIFRKDESARLAIFALMRVLIRATRRGTYYWNRLCRATVLSDFFPEVSSNYASICVSNLDFGEFCALQEAAVE